MGLDRGRSEHGAPGADSSPLPGAPPHTSEPTAPPTHPTMGQQQLLLLVLGIVIVGLAVVVGIQAFGENQKKANADAMTNDAIRIASDAQAWVLKPTAFGGGNGTTTGLTFAKLGYNVGTGTVYQNLNTGTASGNGYTLAVAPDKITVLGSNATRGNYVMADVFGTGADCIVTQVANTTPTSTTAVPAGCAFN